MPPTPAHTVRAGSHADIEALIALAQAEEMATWGDAGAGSFWLRHEWLRDDFDPATDAWVVERNGMVAAFGFAVVEDNAYEGSGIVHPDHRGIGLGALLVRELLGWASRRGAGRPNVRASVWSTDERARDLFSRAGFGQVRRFFHMARTLPAADVQGPVGVVVERPTDPRVAHEVLEEGFAQHWDHEPATFETWWRRVHGPQEAPHPWYDPTLLAVATIDGEPVGAWRGRRLESGLGWIDQIAVRPAARRRGAATALLGDAFAAFATAGAAEVWLNVDATNETGAVALYERAKMSMRRAWDVMEKPLP